MAVLSLEDGLFALERRANAARIVIYLVIAGEILRSIARIAGLAIGANTDANSPLTMIEGVSALLFLISAVFVAMWIYRAHANLRDANVGGLTFTPGWAVGWFFVPIASLFKPFEAMRELWDVSDGHDSRGIHALATNSVKIWWGAFLTGSLIDNIMSRLGDGIAVGFTAIISVVGGTALAISAYYLLGIIAHITRAQRTTLGMARIFS